MNFSEITKITIPEGNVSKITDSNGNILWSSSPVTFLDYLIMPRSSYTQIPFIGDLNNVRFDFSHTLSTSVSSTTILRLNYNSYDYLWLIMNGTTITAKFMDSRQNFNNTSSTVGRWSEQWLSYLGTTNSTDYNITVKRLDNTYTAINKDTAKSTSNNIPESVYINVGATSSTRPLSVKLLEINDIIYKPAKDKEGVIGLFDTTNKILYPSVTTNSFIEPS